MVTGELTLANIAALLDNRLGPLTAAAGTLTHDVANLQKDTAKKFEEADVRIARLEKVLDQWETASCKSVGMESLAEEVKNLKPQISEGKKSAPTSTTGKCSPR